MGSAPTTASSPSRAPTPDPTEPPLESMIPNIPPELACTYSITLSLLGKLLGKLPNNVAKELVNHTFSDSLSLTTISLNGLVAPDILSRFTSIEKELLEGILTTMRRDCSQYRQGVAPRYYPVPAHMQASNMQASKEMLGILIDNLHEPVEHRARGRSR